MSRVGLAVEHSHYKQQYHRNYNGKTIPLDDHLKKGVDHDPVTTFRLYFHYDQEAGKVVVGHLPSHLDNRST